MSQEPRRGVLGRTWHRLRSPSARWSVLALVFVGILIGFAATVGTQVMVAATGTNQFCGGACHSMQWVAQEYRQSGHAVNRTGVSAGCHDCHIPHNYPELLWYKAVAGTKDDPFVVLFAIFPEDKQRCHQELEISGVDGLGRLEHTEILCR